jgi:hypothetical protein
MIPVSNEIVRYIVDRLTKSNRCDINSSKSCRHNTKPHSVFPDLVPKWPGKAKLLTKGKGGDR